MNVLNSKPQINLKNHISNKNKGESIRYCPKITVPNTLALSRFIVKNYGFSAQKYGVAMA